MVEPEHAETAGTMMAFMLIIGLGVGAGFSFVITLFLWNSYTKLLTDHVFWSLKPVSLKINILNVVLVHKSVHYIWGSRAVFI